MKHNRVKTENKQNDYTIQSEWKTYFQLPHSTLKFKFLDYIHSNVDDYYISKYEVNEYLKELKQKYLNCKFTIKDSVWLLQHLFYKDNRIISNTKINKQFECIFIGMVDKIHRGFYIGYSDGSSNHIYTNDCIKLLDSQVRLNRKELMQL